MMWYWGGGVHWWGWLVGGLGMLAFWGLVLWAVWYLVTSPGRRPPERASKGDDPQRILGERLARGEIDADEYRHLRDVLCEANRRHAADVGSPTGVDAAQHLG